MYYGKLKNRKLSNHYIALKTHRTTILNRSESKNPNNESNSLAELFDIGAKTSMEIKKPLKKENSWKFQNFDPWEKPKAED